MPELKPFGRFFLPGPTEVRPEILQAQVGPMMGHRTPETEALVERIEVGLKDLFRTERPVYISSSSATGMMEAGIRNAVRERALCLVNGAFSERFARIADACDKDVDSLEVEWGEPHTPEQVRDALASSRYDAVTVVHCETSTGVLNPLEDLARVVHEAGDVAILVDGVTSVGGLPVLTDEWKLDYVLTGSQKALALPPGLALGVAQAHMLDRARDIDGRGIYFDFAEFERNLEKNQTPNTPATSLLYALDAQLADIAKETLEARWARHAAMARRTHEWVEEARDRGVDVRIVAPEGYRSNTVTCLWLPDDWSGPRVCAALSERGCTVAPGYGKLKERMFRIGHMGDHTVEELEELLGFLEEILEP